MGWQDELLVVELAPAAVNSRPRVGMLTCHSDRDTRRRSSGSAMCVHGLRLETGPAVKCSVWPAVINHRSAGGRVHACRRGGAWRRASLPFDRRTGNNTSSSRPDRRRADCWPIRGRTSFLPCTRVGRRRRAERQHVPVVFRRVKE